MRFLICILLCIMPAFSLNKDKRQEMQALLDDLANSINNMNVSSQSEVENMVKTFYHRKIAMYNDGSPVKKGYAALTQHWMGKAQSVLAKAGAVHASFEVIEARQYSKRAMYLICGGGFLCPQVLALSNQPGFKLEPKHYISYARSGILLRWSNGQNKWLMHSDVTTFLDCKQPGPCTLQCTP